MTGVTWLHLSDWHQKTDKDFDRKIVLRALLKDIRERNKISSDLEKIDFVIFSGDVAFGGKPEEYQAAKEQFFQPILEACKLEPEQLFIVPGNHDLDRNKFKLLPGDLKKPLSTEKEVQEWLTDDCNRPHVLEPFQAFNSFFREYSRQDSPDYTNVRIIEVNDKKIALLGLNSAWMCGRNKEKIGDYGYVIVGEPQISDAIDEISGADLKIAILHHPFKWLSEFDQNRIEYQLRRGCDFILQGHQHSSNVEIVGGTFGDCVIIPAGASYDRRMPENPRYANSYNFVHLDLDTGKGAVFLRRWSDDGNRWLEDIVSCEGGVCNLDLSKSDARPSIDETLASIKLIPHQIPAPPRDFKGREDEIRDILSNFEKGATITGLRGMGGVGKTALALVLADKLKSRFPDGQIFIDMRGTSTNPINPPMTPDEAMAHVIRAFKPIDRLPENQNELRGLYISTLTGKKVLLLLDNAASNDQVYPLPPPEGCSVIITSRIKFESFGLVEKDLDILPPKDARELLLEIAPRIGERADELASLCGYLPLALRNAASALAEKKDLKVSEYEQRLKDKFARLELVRSSFSVSYDLLSPMRKKHWRRLSGFPEDFDRDAATAVLKMSPEASAEALRDLVRWSLVDYIPTAGSDDGRYKLHDLARIFTESCLAQGELADIQQRHAKYYSKVLSQANDLYLKGEMDLLEGLKLFDLEWANIKVGHAWAKSSIKSGVINKRESKLVTDLAWSYANNGVQILDLRLHPRDQISWFETGLVAVRMRKDRSAEGAALNNLGATYNHLAETRKAIEFYEQGLTISREIGDRRREGSNLVNQGNAYNYLGETRKAIEFYEQALTIFRETDNKRGVANILGNLGATYNYLGETRKAIEFYEQSLTISREIGDSRGVGNLLNNLGLVSSNLGEMRKAIELYEQSLTISREIGNRRSEAASLDNLGVAYSDLGETRKAIELYEQALVISREIENKRIETECLCDLGKTYLDLKETGKAIDYCTNSMDLARTIECRKIEGDALCTLGKAFAAEGDLQKGVKHCDQALKIFKDIEYPKGEANSLFVKATALHQLNENEEAAQCAQEALWIFQKIESPMAEKVRQMLAEWQEGQGS